jgi:hypothetical protein
VSIHVALVALNRLGPVSSVRACSTVELAEPTVAGLLACIGAPAIGRRDARHRKQVNVGDVGSGPRPENLNTQAYRVCFRLCAVTRQQTPKKDNAQTGPTGSSGKAHISP